MFLDRPDVPYGNSRFEREIRPAVIAHKNTFQNASAQAKGSREAAPPQSQLAIGYSQFNAISDRNDPLRHQFRLTNDQLCGGLLKIGWIAIFRQ